MKSIIEECLDELETLAPARAAQLREKFEGRSEEDIEFDEVQRVVDILEEAQEEADAQTGESSDARDPEPETTDERGPLGPLEDYRHFVESLPDGPDLVDAVDALARSRDFESLEHAASHVFTDTLGFTPNRLDASQLFDQYGLDEVVRIATFGDFNVTVVRLDTFTPYSTTLRPVFRQYPYGLVMTITPSGRTIRVVYQQVAADGDLRMRTLAGKPFGREPSDNVLVWAKRFSLMRPEYGDDAERVRHKVHAAFELDSREVTTRWQSTPLENGEPAGIGWEEAPVREVQSLLQTGTRADERRHWGLQAALRDRSPMKVAGGEARIEFLGYEVVDTDIADHRETPAPGETRAAICQLDLRCEVDRDGETVSQTHTIPCRIPIPDEHGVFVIDGNRYAFHPRLDNRGELFRELEFDDDFIEEFSAALEERLDDEPDDTEREARESGQRVYRGASIRGLLECLVDRKLGGIASQVWREEQEHVDKPGDLLATLSTWFDGEDRLRICAERMLAEALEPVVAGDSADSHLRTVTQPEVRPETTPPAWACIDLSADLEPGRWYPVASARLHPGDGLAIPTETEAAPVLAVSRQSALAHNPRAEADVDQPLEWWMAAPLRAWSSTVPGHLEQPSRVARRHTQLEDLSVVRISGETLQAHTASGMSQSLPRRRWSLVTDLPVTDGDDPEVTLLVEEDEYLEPGEPWLRIDPNTWESAVARPVPQSLQAAGKLLDEDDLPDRERRFARLPPEIEGRVVSIEWKASRNQFGLVERRRVILTVIAPPRSNGDVVLPDGRLAPVANTLGRADFPYGPDGERPDVVVEDPRLSSDTLGDEGWFDGGTGEPIRVATTEKLDWVPREDARNVVPPDEWLEFRLIDREGRPATPNAPGISERRWRWLAVTHPEVASRLERVDRTWNAGAPAYWPRLVQALSSAAIDPPELGPAAWQTNLEKRPSKRVEYDPMRTRLQNVHSQFVEPWHADSQSQYEGWCRNDEDIPFEPLVVWRCDCGALQGPHRAVEKCERCDGRVQRHRRPIEDCPLPVLELPVRVLHPWYRDEAAALLGVEPRELDDLIDGYGGPHVTDAVESALETPARNIEERIRLADDETASCLRRLKARLDETASGLEEKVFLEAVPLLPPVLRPAGVPWGSPDLLVSPINGKYRELNRAIEQCEKVGEHAPNWLRGDVWVGLQDAVDQLFGECDSPSEEFDTVASIIRRLFPPTRPSALRTTLPGTFRAHAEFESQNAEIDRATDSDAPEQADAWREYVEEAPDKNEVRTDTKTARTGVVTADGARTLPEPTVAGLPSDPDFWSHRRSKHALLEHHLRPLAAILGALDGDDELLAYLELYVGIELPEQIREDLGAVVLRELLRLVEFEEADPAGLCEVLNSDLPLNLPADTDDAFESFVDRLDFGPASSRAEFVHRALFYVFGGWWQTDADTGWQWYPGFEHPEPANRRAAPPVSSPAWDRWPHIDFGRTPLRWFRRHPEEIPSTLRALLRWNVPNPPELFEATQTSAEVAPEEPQTTFIEQRTSTPTRPQTSRPPKRRGISEADESTAEGETNVRVLEQPLASWISKNTSDSTGEHQ